jgi:phosphoglycerate kinase
MFQFDDIRRLSELELEEKRVFVRADFDCALTPSGELKDDSKLHAAVPTLRYLLERGVRTVVGGHLGPLGKSRRKRPSLDVCGERLADLLATEIYLPDENGGPLAQKLIAEQKPGTLILLENLARDAGEAEVSLEHAREQAKGFDVYVGDALPGTLETSSLSVLPKLCAERAMGLRLEAELIALRTVVDAPRGSTVWCIGGTFAERQRVLVGILPLAPVILPGAALAHILLAASGQTEHVAESDREFVPAARTWLEHARDHGAEVLLPSDFQCGSLSTPLPRRARELKHDEPVLDLGPASIARYQGALPKARHIVVLDELGALAQYSTAALLEAVVGSGRPSYVALDEEQRGRAGARDWGGFGFVSTSKDGVLALLQRQRLAALDALRMNAV